MVHSVNSKGMSPHQLALLERALLVLSKIDEGGWNEMPLDLRISFAKYMDFEVWTHLPDLLTLREAALKIVRDAIARTGEFKLDAAEEDSHDEPPVKTLVAG
jgi:hypothetical protein